ncbi:MAG: nucleoside deaminase [Lactobacillus sp.]|jgi:tRNA(Arg) A34 adenosine deaminase TadA|nr:nucleoside deaminase [Lactobacillus sp.]
MGKDEQFMQRAIDLSRLAVEHGNEPFGAVLVKDGKIVFENENQIHTASDPTFHAETGLIRRFCQETGTEDLSSYSLYTSCEPCMMCSAAMVWAKLGKMVYGASNIYLEEKILHQQGSHTSELTFQEMGRGPATKGGILRDQAFQILQSYFG